MKLTSSPAGRALKWFASTAGAYAGAMLFLTLLQYLGFVRHPEDVIKTIFSVWYVGAMFIICIGLLLIMTVCSIFTYVKVCKENQKKFLLFALPAHIISAALMFLSLVLITKGKDTANVGCIINLIAALIAVYLTVITIVFKHVAYGKARKNQ